MRRLLPLLLAACACLAAAPAAAQISQTITIDGLNDFNVANIVEDDTLDTETKAWCTTTVISPMDIGRFYVTNDNNFLYFGYYQNPGDPPDDCFLGTTPQLGLAIDVNTAGGNTTDAFSRKLAWNLVPKKPDWYVYIELNGFNYEVLYQNNAGVWNVNTDGSDGLGARGEDTHFIEFRLPLATLGVSAGDTIHYESWWTQNASNKGPLDALCSDAVQMSTPGGTTFDTTIDIEMTNMKQYVIQAFVDNTDPTVLSASAVNFNLLGDLTWAPTSNQIDVQFSEPVDVTTAQNAFNYAVSGAASPLVLTATVDGSDASLVHLLLSTPVSANAAFFDVTVTGVEDQNNNTISTNNVGSFFLQNVVFQLDARAGLCQGSLAVTDTFTVEGGTFPLTFTLCDNTRAYDGDADSIYAVTLPLSLPKNSGTGKAESLLEYKWGRNCEFEGGSNRQVTVSSDSGATATLNSSWENLAYADLSKQPIDVVFQIDMSMASPVPGVGDTVYLQGNQGPLTFDDPGMGSGIIMLDDGLGDDVSAGDKIYTARATFPTCTNKDVNWKIYYMLAYECSGQGDRDVFLNDDLFSTSVPIVLPARKFDRCSVTDKAVAVNFFVDMSTANPLPAAGDTVALGGDRAPLDFDAPWTATMADDGISPDLAAGDNIYSISITFPDSTDQNLGFKHWLGYNAGGGGAFECFGVGNRTLKIDDVNFSTSTPQTIQSAWGFCTSNVGVPLPLPTLEVAASFAVLKQSFPNPFVPRATIRFDLKKAGRVTLRVYDIAGRHVQTLVDRDMVVGPYEAIWKGTNSRGQKVQAGIYIYELAMGGESLSRRMVYTK